MAIKTKMTKKRVAKKKVARKKAVARQSAVDKNAALVASLREKLKAAKAANSELAKKVQAGDRQVSALLKLLGATQVNVNKFLARSVKDAVAKYEIAIAPKKRRRSKKKKAAKK
ncbi:hypothetical protein MNBD_GAMMA26-1675 [hydrothermal vent metagenome]|uniref:Uncharacterized protein n=1 Tax=hydrothermal vent metagenome TaxID=652676 RepID=A0A3B1BTJ6_9ZZZZ